MFSVVEVLSVIETRDDVHSLARIIDKLFVDEVGSPPCSGSKGEGGYISVIAAEG
jgi:hypothetical protein